MMRSSISYIIDTIYDAIKKPCFILDKDQIILDQPKNFIEIPNLFFKSKCFEKTTSFLFEKDMFFFYFKRKDEWIVIGPILYRNIMTREEFSKCTLFYSLKHRELTEKDYMKIPTLQIETFFSEVAMVYFIITSEQLDMILLKKEVHAKLASINYNDLLYVQKIENHEKETAIFPFDFEQQLLHYIVTNQRKKALSFIHQTNLKKFFESHRLSNQPKHELVSILTLIRSEAILAGCAKEDAFYLSDILIEKGKTCVFIEDVYKLFRDMVVLYCDLIHVHQYQEYPTWLVKCLDYINENLYQIITLKKLSAISHYSESYLSAQFPKYMNQTIISYILFKKIEEAKYLLLNSTYNITQISALLAFSSQSYFSTVFKKLTGFSPKRFIQTYKSNIS